MEEKRKSHLGLKLLGIWRILWGALYLIAGISILVVGTLIAIPLTLAFVGIPILIATVVIGGVLIALGLFILFLGFSLYRERPWAYYLEWIFSTVNIIVALVTLNWIGLIVPGIIFIYMLLIHKDMNPKFCTESGFGKFLCTDFGK